MTSQALCILVLVGRDKFGILGAKLGARFLLALANLFFVIYFFLPLLHILMFNQVTLLKGIDAIFHTESAYTPFTSRPENPLG